MTTWGVVSTVKAPLTDILAFAAHHLDLGAHRLYIYLDDPEPDTFNTLKSHPKIRPTACDDGYWQKQGMRPRKHQVRQGRNATHAYNRRAEVDWLAHIDVDEFLAPPAPLSDLLAALPPAATSARIYPVEALAGDGTRFKRAARGPDQAVVIDRIYPVYGRYLRGGFMSHVAGKLFARTGLEGVDFRIHNVLVNRKTSPDGTTLDGVDLCHFHAKPWEDWFATYRYRLQNGSYRPELPPAVPHDRGGLTLHELFTAIETEDGEAGLRAFFDEVCADTPMLRARLAAEGLLCTHDLQLSAKIRKHFPEFPEIVA